MICHTNAMDALATVRSNHRVFVHGACATPFALLYALVESAPRLRGVEIVHLHTLGIPKYTDPKFRGHFKTSALFVGSNMRSAIETGMADYIPCFLSEIPMLFKSGRLPLDVALVHVSPPDKHGFCSLGTSVDVARAAVDCAKIVIAQINPKMPRVHGDGLIHVNQIHHAVEVDMALPDIQPTEPTEVERKIGRLISEMVEDGATLQMGIGSIPDAALTELTSHRHLGIHTETWSDRALDLILSGAVDNSLKKIHPGRTVSGFVMGSKRVQDFIHDNPSVIQLDVEYVNNPVNIARNPKVVAINSAVEVDLTGQVCADSVGTRIISGAGGQMDFIRGASLSPGGKPIIAISSRTKSGVSRLVPTLRPGAGVVTTRAHVHYIVTEFGVADLFGKSLRERAKALIAIAHPEDRESLEHAVRKETL